MLSLNRCLLANREFGQNQLGVQPISNAAIVQAGEVTSTRPSSQIGSTMSIHRSSIHWRRRRSRHRRKCCYLLVHKDSNSLFCAAREGEHGRIVNDLLWSAASPSPSLVPSSQVPLYYQPLLALCILLFCCSLLWPLGLVNGPTFAHANHPNYLSDRSPNRLHSPPKWRSLLAPPFSSPFAAFTTVASVGAKWNFSKGHLHGSHNASNPANYDHNGSRKLRSVADGIRERDEEEKNQERWPSLCKSEIELVTFCGNDTDSCFLTNSKCDGVSDCNNGFDESWEMCGCLEHEFLCNQTCTDKSLVVCNTIVECEGSADEKNCETYVCPETHFKCNNHFCIPVENVCNFVNNCGDNSDEEECSHRDCWFGEYKCDNGQCIQAYGVCNKVADCIDKSDEKQCHEQDFVHCDNGVSVHRSLWCDGRPEPDCPSQNDEQNCRECQPNEFRCANSRCIPRGNLCDTVCDCANSCEDEKQCADYYSKEDGVTNCSSANTIACSVSESGKSVERCLGKDYICDGFSDCPRIFDDEYGCSYGGYNKQNCAQMKDHFWCATEKRCLPSSVRCNFIQECLFGLDELDCEREPCAGFQCANGQCIASEFRCDSVVHCFDKSDEICENFLCPSGFKSCNSGQCVRNEFWCDGYFEDCLDKSDETASNCNFTASRPATCDPMKQFRCDNGQCISSEYRCLKSADPRQMCADGSNLRNCGNWTCQNTGQIKCAGSYCVDLQLKCNERLDCPVLSDWADEISCPFFCSKNQACPCIDTTINCTAQELTNIPDGIEDQILRMILKGNKLGRNLTLNMFNRLDRMHMIDLSENEITYIPPGLFRKLWKLRILHLRKNSIDVIDSYTFTGMPNLVTLTLNGNKIVVIREHAFSGLASLKTLDLSNQRISSLQKNSFSGLRTLKNLDLSGNHIYELSDGLFSGLQAVISIDLLGNAISRVGDKVFLGLTSLKQITFDEFRFCCLVRHVETCHPPPNEFSSCEDLMSNSILRICIWVLGSVALVGNLFVISWRVKFQTVNRVHSFLIINLALGDLLMGIYLLIIASVDSYYRLITITFPFRIYKMCMKDAKVILAILWLVAIILSGLPLIRFRYFDNFYGRSGVCLALHITNERPSGWEYSVFIFLVLNLISFTLICGSYLWMFITARNTQIAARSMENHQQNRMARRMMFIVLTDAGCWMPIITLGIVSIFGVPIPPQVFAWIAVFILPLNAAVNPMLYTLSGLTFYAKKANNPSPSLIRMSVRQNNGSFKGKTSYL